MGARSNRKGCLSEGKWVPENIKAGSEKGGGGRNWRGSELAQNKVVEPVSNYLEPGSTNRVQIRKFQRRFLGVPKIANFKEKNWPGIGQSSNSKRFFEYARPPPAVGAY